MSIFDIVMVILCGSVEVVCQIGIIYSLIKYNKKGDKDEQ